MTNINKVLGDRRKSVWKVIGSWVGEFVFGYWPFVKAVQSPRQSNTAYNSTVFSFSGKGRKHREAKKRISIRFPVMNSKFSDTQIHNLK